MVNERLVRMKTGAIDETRKLFWIFIYLWVLLSLFSLHKALVLNDESLIFHQGFALINALALAKVVLVAEFFHVGDNFKNKPLIYPIMFKSAVFARARLCSGHYRLGRGARLAEWPFRRAASMASPQCGKTARKCRRRGDLSATRARATGGA